MTYTDDKRNEASTYSAAFHHLVGGLSALAAQAEGGQPITREDIEQVVGAACRFSDKDRASYGLHLLEPDVMAWLAKGRDAVA